VTAKVGTRRLLIALSVLYWIAAMVTSFAASLGIVGQCDARLPAINGPNDVLWDRMFYECRDALLPAVGIFMGLSFVLFVIISAIYLTVRWIIRGYRQNA
jgi:hypothetical protein